MSAEAPRKAQRARLVRRIVAHIDEFPRQHTALENAMEAFGGEFDLPLFKAAFETVEDMEAYNHVQAIERAVGRVQGFVADMAMDGVRLAQLPSEPEGGEGFRAKHAFAALRETGVIDGKLCRLLVESQEARTAIEHEYIRLRAGRLHQATLQVRDSSREFYELFRAWIEPYLD